MRLKTRVTLAVTAVTAAALGASFVTVSLLVARDETRDLDHALLLQARAMAQIASLEHAERSIVSEGSVEVPESWGSITRYMAEYEPSGALISASKSFGGRPPESAELSATWPPEDGASTNLAAGDVNLRGVLIPLGERGPVLLYAVPRRTVDEDLQFITRAVSGIFVAAMLLTSLVARWLSGRLSSDVQSITGVARAVAQGDLNARVGSGVRGSTETQMLASDMDHMIGQLSALVVAQRTFVSHAAHELRSPLATIRGELQLALRRPRDASGYRSTIEEVLSDVDSLAALAEDLLVLARVQANASGPGQAPTATPLGDVVSDALRLTRGAATERDVRLAVAPDERAAWHDLSVGGARGELARALRNLVDNAIAHSQGGGRVDIDIERRGELAAITVTDEGPGVPAADRDVIFEPFFRGSNDQGGERAGAGLGLTIARGIARAHGGDVTLDGSYEGGARFVLELPIC